MAQDDPRNQADDADSGPHTRHPHGRHERTAFPEFGGFGLFPGFARLDARPWSGGRRAGRGDVRAAILSLLADSPANGYGLMQAIRDRTEGAWRPSSGSVYPTLQQLVDEDLITPTGDGRSTEYTLTDAGRAYVADHADELDASWRGTPRLSDADRDLFRSVGRLISAARQVRFASDAQRAAAIEKIDQTRRELYRILAE